MKKQLLWGALLLLTGFSSCKKDAFKTADENSKVKGTKVNVAQPTYSYADLTLQPRQPGENFDTYKGAWSGAEVKMIGTPTWNQAAYPTLVNGIPGLDASYEVTSNGNLITSSTVAGQDFIMLTVGTIQGLQWGKQFKDALDKFQADVMAYDPSTSPAPSPFPATYLPNILYKDATSYVVAGKLIRVTTGSHWALATVDYPTPTPVAPPNPKFLGAVPDPNDNTLFYDVYGINGNVTITKIFKGGTEQSAGGGFSSGTYTLVGGNVYHVSVTVYRANGTSFVFNGNLDIS